MSEGSDAALDILIRTLADTTAVRRGTGGQPLRTAIEAALDAPPASFVCRAPEAGGHFSPSRAPGLPIRSIDGRLTGKLTVSGKCPRIGFGGVRHG